MWTVSLPLTIVNGVATRSPELQAADFVGWAMWAIGAVIEMVADQQKLSFKKDPASRGKWCDIGVWKFSRHPNYFGEVYPESPFASVCEKELWDIEGVRVSAPSSIILTMSSN